MSRNKTTEDFIREAKEIHGNKYDYTKTVYTKARDKVIITCPLHGDVELVADSHVGKRAYGCRFCGIERRVENSRMSKEEFVIKAKNIHGDKYDYSNVEDFKSNRDKVTIICKIHGDFSQIISNHLKGAGCRLCGHELISIKNRLDVDEFKNTASKKHNNKFDYSKITYKNMWEKIDIICPQHGLFSQSPINHIEGVHGCPKCADEYTSNKLKTTFEDFVLKANDAYKYKYSYHKETYKNIQTKTKITCPIHGDFWQLPHIHISSMFGCPRCSIEYRSGEGHYNYNQYLTELERENNRAFPEVSVWRNLVYKRDNYRCAITNEKVELNAHHLDGWHWCKEKRFDINNGVSLSGEIHNEFHSMYGRKNNTREQFEEFYKIKTGKDFVQIEYNEIEEISKTV